MPWRIGGICPDLTCRQRTPCPVHRSRWNGTERWNDAERGNVTQRGYGHAHRVWRAQVLEREPLCRYGYPGCTRVSTVADHIVQMRLGGAPRDLANGAGCCRHCHAIKSNREGQRMRR